MSAYGDMGHGMGLDLSFNTVGNGKPLVVLHGLFGSKRNWYSIAKRLARDRRVLAVDLRNHGDSPWDTAHTYPDMAQDVARLIEQEAGGPADVVGHSMGGKTAMALSLLRPDLVDRLAVVDIAPAPSGGTLIDFVHTMQALDLSPLTRRAEVEALLSETIGDPGVTAFLAHNVRSGETGALEWQLNLAAIAENFEDILGFPDFDSDRAFDRPTVFLAGSRSDYIQPPHHAEIDRLFPSADISVVKDAGHWVHAEQPAAFIRQLTDFLEH